MSIITPLVSVSLGSNKDILIKDDSQTNSDYGGTKFRKLKYLFNLIDRVGIRNNIVSFGGIGSNWLAMLNYHINKRYFGKVCVFNVVVNQPWSVSVERNLWQMREYGCHTELVQNTKWLLNKDLNQIATYLRCLSRAKIFKKIHNCLEIAPGGSNKFLCQGMVEAGEEIFQQLYNLDCQGKYNIFIPVGSCGSIAGIAAGIAIARFKTGCPLHIKLHGTAVVEKYITNRNRVNRLIKECLCDFPDVITNYAIGLYDLNHQYLGRCYGDLTLDSMRYTSETKQKIGIHIDPCYTGKSMAHMTDYMQKSSNSADEAYVLWNTYGHNTKDSRLSNHADIAMRSQKIYRELVEAAV